MLQSLYVCDLMDLCGFCDLMDLSGLSNRFCVFRFGISSAGIDYFLVFRFGFRLLCLDSDLAGLQAFDATGVRCADVCSFVLLYTLSLAIQG